MVFVTRCPYCGCVWRLPDRETTERGPVKCSACQNSFDATSDLLQVPESLFPDMPHPVRPIPPSTPAQAPAMMKVEAAEPAASLDAGAKMHAPQPAAPAVEAPAHAEPTGAAVVRAAAPENTSASPDETASKTLKAPSPADAFPDKAAAAPQVEHSNEPQVGLQTPHLQGVPLNSHSGGLSSLRVPAAGELAPLASAGRKTEPHLGALPASGLSKAEPHLDVSSLTAGDATAGHSVAEAHRSVGSIIPSQAGRSPRDVKVFMAPAPETPDHVPGSSRAAGIASVATAVILLIVLAGVLSIVFNQRILTAFPQAEPFFIKVCGKVPCPGFFLADAAAFEVTRADLRAVDESGNYLLEITVENRSNFAQAVPSLEIILVDEADNELMRRTLEPRDYLSDPVGTESLAPGRAMSVRFSLQTNVTPTRCIVTPVFPRKDASS